MFVYNIDVLAELKSHGYSTYKLQQDKIMSGTTIQKLYHGEIVSIASLDVICRLLGCQPNRVIKWVKED